MKLVGRHNCRLLWLLPLLAIVLFSAAPGAANKPPSNFRVVLDSPRGNDKKTRLMLKNSLSAKSEDIYAMIEKAKKEFQHISHKTKEIATKMEGEARELVDKFKDNLQHYTKLELGFYAALTVALTVTLKSTYGRNILHFDSWRCSFCFVIKDTVLILCSIF
jgi:hypothetical protein